MWLRADTFTLFVLARIVGGLSKANVNVATAIIADVYEPKDHPKGMVSVFLDVFSEYDLEFNLVLRWEQTFNTYNIFSFSFVRSLPQFDPLSHISEPSQGNGKRVLPILRTVPY